MLLGSLPTRGSSDLWVRLSTRPQHQDRSGPDAWQPAVACHPVFKSEFEAMASKSGS